jgi:uncharacterized protein (DUF1330 family)
MPKAYVISCYRSVSDPDKLTAYAKIAGPAIAAAGGKFLARGPAAKAYEAGVVQRTVIIEFPSLADAMALYESPQYSAALKALDGGADRDMRVVEGVE